MPVERHGRGTVLRRAQARQDAVDELSIVRSTDRAPAPLREGALHRQHPPDLAGQEPEEREEGGLASRPLARHRLTRAVGTEGREGVPREEALEDAQRLDRTAADDGVDEVGAVLLLLVENEPCGRFRRDPWALRRVDQTIQLRQECARLRAAAFLEELENLGLDDHPAREGALEPELLEPR